MMTGADSFSILFSPRSFQKPIAISPRAFGGFLERFGSLERMEMEVTPRIGLVYLGLPLGEANYLPTCAKNTHTHACLQTGNAFLWGQGTKTKPTMMGKTPQNGKRHMSGSHISTSPTGDLHFAHIITLQVMGAFCR